MHRSSVITQLPRLSKALLARLSFTKLTQVLSNFVTFARHCCVQVHTDHARQIHTKLMLTEIRGFLVGADTENDGAQIGPQRQANQGKVGELGEVVERDTVTRRRFCGAQVDVAVKCKTSVDFNSSNEASEASEVGQRWRAGEVQWTGDPKLVDMPAQHVPLGLLAM
ncbi:hypothetical protein BCR44DRAFT_296516 [Catenaria anguillulae PL171]|uniref:Uncharacterized protein n=1 Tax=Catenaria anguillulae PL171 TaxID=765915 RepID=A0A1Y2HPT1_9FUNG|nr:hypothetical protein BCR44DRAFT_296516 [Catenaria anguillulae PL171]